MKDTAPKEQGILLIAAVFGFIGGGIAFVAYDWGLPSSALVALIVAIVVAIVLWLGWREPKVRPMTAGVGPVAPMPASDGGRRVPGPAAATGPVAAPAVAHATAGVGGDATVATRTVEPAGAADDTATAGAAHAGGAGAAVAAAPEPTMAQGDMAPGETGRGGAAATTASGGTGGGAVLKPSARLAGQEELASRKGSWKYDATAGASEAEATPEAASAPAARPGAAGASAAETAGEPGAMNGESAAAIAAREDTPDGDDDMPVAADGEQPAMLSAPREGGADNLKEIKGVGPKLENTLHDLGIYHFDQIAGWSAQEVAWMDGNLKGFRGRVSRDNWVEQAKILASGGETEFSRRVDKGSVY